MSENGTELPIHDVRLYGEYWGQSGPAAGVAKSTQMTQMYGPAVRRKRFSSIWRMRSCINVSGLRLERIWLRAIMDISARAISLADRPRTGHLGHQCSHAPGRPVLHLVSSSRRPRRVRCLALYHRELIGRLPGLSSPRSSGHAQERSRRCAPACWRGRWRARCGATASWPPRARV